MFATRFKKLREEAGFERQELADRLGVSRNTISNYENNIRKPKTDDSWRKLAHFFGVSVDYLMGEEITNLPTEEIHNLLSRGLILKTDIPETKMSDLSTSDTSATFNTDVKLAISEQKLDFIEYIHSIELNDDQIKQIKLFINTFVLKS